MKERSVQVMFIQHANEHCASPSYLHVTTFKASS